MGNTLIQELLGAGQLAMWLRYYSGSLVEVISGSTPTIGSPTLMAWGRGRRGFGVTWKGGYIQHPGTTANKLLLQRSIFVFFNGPHGANVTRDLIQKFSTTCNYYFYTDVSGGGKLLLFDGTHYSAAACLLSGASMLGVTSVDGALPNFYKDGAALGPGNSTTTLVGNTNAVTIGGYNPGSPAIGEIIEVTRALTSAESARLYDEFLATPMRSPDLPRRNFVYIDKGKADWEYAAAGIVLDTKFESIMVGATRKIADDSPSNYQGTIVGTPTPASGGTGQSFNAYTDDVSFGDVTQLNSAASFSIESIFDLPAAAIGSTWFCVKKTDNNNRIAIGAAGGVSATAKQIYAYVANGAGTYGVTNAPGYLRAGTKQHVLVVYNGNGATDADRLKIWLDGELTTLTLAGPIPATTANMVGAALRNGTGVETMLGTYNSRKVYTGALTPAQARAAYLANFAQRLTLRETFEDVPVSLAGVAAGGFVGQWRLASGAGTNVCMETSDGKRWLTTNNTAEWVFAPQPDAFGTWRFYLYSHQINPLVLGFIADAATPFGTGGPNGYAVYLSAAGRIQLIVMTAGAVAANVMYSATGYIAPDTLYEIVVNRRPSDGQFTMWIKGGAFTQYTLVSTAGGGGGSNPGADLTYTTSKAMCLQLINGDRLLGFDPQNRSEGLFHYQGVLSPVDGELP